MRSLLVVTPPLTATRVEHTGDVYIGEKPYQGRVCWGGGRPALVLLACGGHSMSSSDCLLCV